MPLLAYGVVLTAVLLAAPGVVAQDPPMRWGRISDAEVAMTAFEGDPEAAAIVLGDFAFDELVPSREGARFTRRRHRRVKVLSEAGYEEGEFSYQYSQRRARKRHPGSDVRAPAWRRDAPR